MTKIIETTLENEGKILLPNSIRNDLSLNGGDIFEINVLNGKIIMTPKKINSTKKAFGDDPLDYIGITKGIFGSEDEIDEYIRKERESWN